MAEGLPLAFNLDDPNAVGITPDAPDTAVSLPTPGPSQTPLPPEIAQQRADKTHQGLGEVLQKTPSQLYEDFLAGEEVNIRKQAATQLDYQRHMDVYEQLKNTPGPLTPEMVQGALTFGPTNNPTDPATVIESAYSDKYINQLKTAQQYMSDNILDKAQAEMPQQADQALVDGSTLATKNQYLQNVAQDMQQSVSEQSWPGYIWDEAKQLFQPYVEYNERGLISGVLDGLGLGTNINNARQKLYDMPLPQFRETVDKVREQLKSNPSLAASYFNSLLSQGPFETVLNNTFSALMVPDNVGTVKGAAKLISKINTFNQVRTAAKQMVEAAAADVKADPANAIAASGDVKNAVATKVGNEIASSIEGKVVDPFQTAREPLFSSWKDLAENFIANPGTALTRELYTRVYDSIGKDLGDLYNRISTISRVERQPLAVTSKEVIATEADSIRQNFKGPNAMLADLSGPRREEFSGTYWWKAKLVDYNGELFADEATALGRAESLGFKNVRVLGQEPDRVYLPEAAVMRNEYSDFLVEGKTTTKKTNPEAFEGRTTFNGLTKDQVKEEIAQAKTELKNATDPFDKKLLKDHIKEHEEGLKLFDSKPKVEAKTKNTYLPGSTRKVFRDDFTIQTGKGGFKFIDKDGVEVAPHLQPDVGLIPYNLKTNKFEPPVTAESTRIAQQGLGFYIEHLIPRRETSDTLADLMIKTTTGEAVPDAISTNSATGMRRVVNSLLGYVRNSEDTLAKNDSINRAAATYAKSNLEKWVQGLNKDMEDIKNGIIREDPVTGEPISGFISRPKSWFGKVISGNQMFKDFQRTLSYSREANDGKGAFFKNIGELQSFYNANFNRDPSYLEVKAYFNYVKVKEGERMMSEMAEFRNRAIQGYEQKKLHYTDNAGNLVETRWFDGRDYQKGAFPGGNDFIYIQGEKKGDVKKLGHINDNRLSTMKEMVKSGQAKIFEIYDIDHHPLNGFDPVAQDQRIRYIFAIRHESKQLEFNHVENRGGAHFEWDYDHYIKQADVRTQHNGDNIYVGDKTVMPIANRALGNKVIKIWNDIHGLIEEGKWDEAKPLIAKLGIDQKTFTGWYHPGRDEFGQPTRPRLSSQEPMVVVTKDKRIHDIDDSLQKRYRNFTDGTRTGSANNFKVAYNTERNSFAEWGTINDVGTKKNPIFQQQPAEFVDPISTMNRAVNRAINSVFADDYKLYAVNHWLREAEPYLEAKGGVEEIRSSPFWYFNNANSVYRKDMDITQRMNLETNRYKIQSFIGIPSSFDKWVHSFTNLLADSAYNRSGPQGKVTALNALRHPINIAPIWVLHRLTNPVDFIRGATFNFKLGLFNPAQFLVQAQTHALIWALEPRHGTVGTYAMLLHGWSRVNKNPAIIDALDEYATKLSGFGSRFRPGEFKEAMEHLDKSGFANVAGEHANLSKAYLPTTNFVQNDIAKGLRLGQTPFRLGEESQRITAWYTAFREFRHNNPTTPIGNIERNQILKKADLLTVNMSRASSSYMNHGVFSMTTQFLNYQIKLAELFWSKRIGETPLQRSAARARILTGFALLYGFPNAVGVTGAPFSDNLREQFQEDLGYIPGEKWLSTMLNEGYPAWMLSLITGRVENVGDRFGSQGWTNIKQFLNSDIAWWQAIGGAGVSTMSNFILQGVDPYWKWAQSWLRGDSEDERFRLKSADLVEPLKQISTVSAGAKWWAAIQTGKWINNQEGYVTDVSPLEGTLLALTGMSPQEQDTMFNNNQLIKGEIEAQKFAFKESLKDYRRGLEAIYNGDPEQGQQYMRNAMTRLRIAGYPPEKMNSFIAIGNKGYESMVDQSDFDFWKEGDFNKRDERLQRYKDINMKDK